MTMSAEPAAAAKAPDLGDLRRLFFVCWPLFLGNTLEWYEFATFGYLEQQMGANFFRGSEVATWLGFALTFVTRPLGGWALGIIGDTLGRRLAVNLSIWGMLAGTVGQGLLPTYLSSGPVLGTIGLCVLILLRILQGLCTAGEISSIATYVVEVGPKESLGQAISLIGITLTVGFLAGLCVVMLCTHYLGPHAMLQWGWRLPFLFAAIPGAVSIWGRSKLPESPLFLEEHGQHANARGGAEAGGSASEEEGGCSDSCDIRGTCTVTTSASTVGTAVATEPTASAGWASDSSDEATAEGEPRLRAYWPALLVGISLIAATAMVRYTGMVWLVSYLKSRGLEPVQAMWAGIASNLVQLVMTLPIGWLTDTKGVAWVTLLGAAAVALGGLPLFALMEANPGDPLAAILALGVGFGTLSALTASTCWLFLAELFPTSIRASGVGVALNVGMTIFGGLGPMVAQALVKADTMAPGILLSAGGLITGASVLAAFLLSKRGVLRLTHIRPTPYFGRKRGS